MDSSGLYQRILTGFAWQGFSKIAVQSVSWISTILVARLLDPRDYGIVAVAAVFVWVMNMVVEMGLSQGLVQKSDTTREEEDAVFWFGVTLGLLFYALLYFAAPAVAGFYAMPALVDVLRVAGLGLVIGTLKSVPVAITMRRLDFRYRALTEMSATLATTVTVLSLAYAGFGVWSLVYGTLAQQITLALGYLPSLGRVPRLGMHFSAIAGILRYGMHIMGGNLAYVLSSRADVFIIGKFLGEQFTGYYTLAFQLATLPLDKIGTVFNHVAFPSLSRVKDNDAQCRTLFLDLHRYLVFIAFPLLLGMALVAEDAVLVLLTEKWLPIVPVLQVLCVINMLRVSGMLIPPLLNSRGKAHWSLRYSLGGVVLLPLGFGVGVQFGLMGVAYAWMLVYPPLYLMLLRYLYRDVGVGAGELWSAAGPTMLATAGMAIAVIAVQQSMADVAHGLRLIAGTFTGVLAYAGIFFIFYEDQVARMRQALRLLRS